MSERDRFADTITIRVSPTMREALKKRAAKEDRSMGSFARMALRRYLELGTEGESNGRTS